MSESILIVDDEEPVRRTFREWLDSAGLDCRIHSAADAETALVLANQQTIDLAILDWNLGAGHDGLQLLEDLYLFNPDVVAIMITGYAHQATPLDAMRMGVRDYLDKNQDLDRDKFLTAVRKQLDRIRPAKRSRRLHHSLLAFREAVTKVVPLVQSTAALTEPVPLPEAIRGLFRFLLRATHARDGVLLARCYDPQKQPAENCQVYDASGNALTVDLVPFARSVAGTAISMQEPCAMNRLGELADSGTVELQPFERGRTSLLAMPLAIAPGVQVVIELFDKEGAGDAPSAAGFNAEDHRLMQVASDLGSDLLRQAVAERRTHRLLHEAVEAALKASDSVAESLAGSVAQRLEQPPPAEVLARLREGMGGAAADADDTLRLAEAVRVLALRHGPAAVRHCTTLVENLRQLLDGITGVSEGR